MHRNLCKVLSNAPSITPKLKIMYHRTSLKNPFFAFFLAFALATIANAQVALRPIAEHFTNTRCSICATRNPALYTNLNDNPSVTYLSIHPSSPYPNCPLSQQNMADNDARTNFYGVYGGTPRLVINGSVIGGGASYGSPTLFNPYLDLTTPYEVDVQQLKYDNDSILTRVVVRTAAPHNLTQALLFAGLAEDTVFVDGGNGEDEHYHVLRNALTDPQGMTIELPMAVGDSAVFFFSAPANSAWDFARIFSLAILQDPDTKAVLQSNRTDTASGNIVSSVGDRKDARFDAFVQPNPAQGNVRITLTENTSFSLELYAPNGTLLHRSSQLQAADMDVAGLLDGLYFIRVNTNQNAIVKKLIVQH
jgi:hypothetical protein